MPNEPTPESEAEQLLPASQSNRARQQRSRKNITHPIGFDDENLEKTFNRKRNITKPDRKSELRRLH